MRRSSRKSQNPSVKEALLLLKDASVAEIDQLIGSLHRIRKAREHLESLFSEGVSAVRRVAEAVVEEATRGGRKTRGRRPGRKGIESLGAVGGLRRRSAGLKPPRPGSLRAMVHEALRDMGPIKTNDLVKHLEKKLGQEAGASFRVRVNQVLGNRRDTSIKKVSRGVYTFAG